MDGVVATNTTISRDAVKGLPHAEEAGGLSGAPVFEASNRVIGQLRAALGKGFPIIGVGGVLSGADAVAKIKAGADVVQIYTGLIYKGPDLVRRRRRPSRQCVGEWRLSRCSCCATCSPIARLLVRPGDSMPNRLTRPGTPCTRPLDHKVGRRLARPADLGPHAGIARQQRAVLQRGPVAAHLGIEGVAAPRVHHQVVGRIHPLHVGAELGLAAHVQRQVHAQPAASGTG
jgi:hypothetical protein